METKVVHPTPCARTVAAAGEFRRRTLLKAGAAAGALAAAGPILTRKARAEDKIGGKTIPAGSFVAVCPWLLHRHRGLWRNPDHFDPDRFYYEKVAPPPGVEPPKPRHKLAYVPFGAGPRTCIGASFARTEAVLILATLGQRYRLTLRPGHPVEPHSRLTLRPRHGLPMTIARR